MSFSRLDYMWDTDKRDEELAITVFSTDPDKDNTCCHYIDTFHFAGPIHQLSMEFQHKDI